MRQHLPEHGRHAGTLDFGVLGQTLFGGELIVRQHRVASLRLIAAAVKPNPLVERLLHGYRPLGRTIEYRTYPHLRLGKPSGAEASAVLRKVLVETLHRDQGGLLITYGDRLSRSDFTDVRANGVPLRILEMNAIVLPARQRGVVAATTPVDIEAGEPVNLVYTCSDLYMTAMGRAVFAGEYARRELGLDARSYLRYRVDNPTLRALLQPFDHVLLPRLTATGR